MRTYCKCPCVTTFVMFLGKALITFTLLVPVSSVRVGQYVIKINKQIRIEFLWKTAESGGIIAKSESSTNETINDAPQAEKKDSDTLSKSLNNNYMTLLF
ncbi:unnamed protein product [Clavelina lepadiformis]|uniref:Uncharacterized protein n=1 Tax=Clavelina lepadiformis TaxID=159417 RepID=A0ABP0GG14_CLALP